ncbi:uncharacterized protein A4U43_C08F24160 [Asparagus officinalis]|nr:uncharacterized protein A4U43_C08F24160 [Asparagus officinalis]
MGASRTNRRLLVLLPLFISIALAPSKVYGIRNLDQDLIRRNVAEKPITVKETDDTSFDVRNVSEAPSPSSFDLNRTSKRRVRRGSDPIHNRANEAEKLMVEIIMMNPDPICSFFSAKVEKRFLVYGIYREIL